MTRAMPAGRRRRRRRQRAQVVGAFVGAVATGAGALFFFDSVSGRRRRKVSSDRAAGAARRTRRRTARASRRFSSRMHAQVQRLRHRSDAPREIDDVTLARKVETELFRDPQVPKGQIVVNAQRGLVQLRGEVPTEDMLAQLVERTRDVRGVRDVESLLHLPGTEAPMHR